ncbi:hypothetical protein [Bacillus sp. SM2101]|uniref:hypothetical protein n=1 Tax=Bacillus sp. SM2101 TaxID=2805366 RepID=UPI001BDE8199|nr:hypothetical protein [Bacillus sp. SM2101]
MKSVKILLFFLTLGLGTLTACSSVEMTKEKTSKNDLQTENMEIDTHIDKGELAHEENAMQEESKDQNEQSNEDNVSAEETMENEDQANGNKSLSVQIIKEKLKLGQSNDEVEHLLGSDYQKGIGAKNSEQLWRYDIGKDENHQPLNDELFDAIDVEGLNSRVIEAQIFITWYEDGTVEKYSIYYINNETGNVDNYRVYYDEKGDIQRIIK